MRILINDHAGHPFQVQLSRWLALNGNEVLHTYCGMLQTPRGALTVKPSDPVSLAIKGIEVGKEFKKYGLVSRWRQELKLGRLLAERARKFNPDVIISANSPLTTQRTLLNYALRQKIPFVCWLQDVLSVGIQKALEQKLPFAVSGPVAVYFRNLEQKIWKKSQHVVVITDDFVDPVKASGVPPSSITTIQNWAPIDEIPVVERDNKWARKHNLADKRCLLYSGTLGLKHNPGLLVDLAVAFREEEDVRVVVNSEGPGADYLRGEAVARKLENLVVFDFQDYNQMPYVLATSDVLIAVLEASAGQFSVPSKVLTYLCARRPLLLAVPHRNLAAKIVAMAGAGRVVSANDRTGFVSAAVELMSDPSSRMRMAECGRKYAETNFNIDTIGLKFLEILQSRDRQSLLTP